LIPASEYPCGGWKSFKENIALLNEHAPQGTVYKVLFLGRHGEAFHNTVAQKYGTAAWKDHWCKEYGDGEIVWGPDPELTPVGRCQAVRVRTIWETQRLENMPLPEIAYCSPLRRAMQTYSLRFGPLCPPEVKAIIMEDCREVIGGHTCDQRRPRSDIQAEFGGHPFRFEFEESFAEEDELWTSGHREAHQEVSTRVRRVMNKIFDSSETYVLLCSHGGWLRRLLEVVDHPLAKFKVPLGAVIPVVLQGVRA